LCSPCADEENIASSVEMVREWGGGGFDVWVNNAAAFVFGDVRDVSSEQWEEVLRTNVLGMAFGIKHAAPVIAAHGGGAIVNVASISAFVAQPKFVPYSTSKGAILQLTRTTAMDLAEDGIRVNAVCPGPIRTGATERHAASLGLTVEDTMRIMEAHMMLKRMGDPAEVAAAVAFLASSDASFITGATLAVDGGYLSM